MLPGSTPQPSAPILPGEGEERVLHLLESITDSFCAFDAEWRVTYLNAAARRMFATHLEDPTSILGRNHWDLFPSTRGTILEHEYRRAVSAQVAVEFETYYDPWRRWISIRAFPVQGGGLVVYFRDVTETKIAVDALRASEERYRTLFTSIDEGFCVIEMIFGPDGEAIDYRFLEINPAFENQTGLREARGKTARELMPDLEPVWFATYGEIARTGTPKRFEQGSAALGRQFTVYAFRLQPAESFRVALLFTDITARHLAETEMARLHRESAARLAELETLLEIIPVGIGLASDPECRHVRTNRVFSQLLRLPSGANASKTAPLSERPSTFRRLDDAGREIADGDLPMQVAAREGREVNGVEFNIVHDDGSIVRLLEYAAPVLDETGRSRGAVGAFVDITERRRIEERHAFLVRVDNAVRALTDPAEIVSVAARLLGEHLGADRCAYATIEEDEDTMHITGDYTRGVPSIVGCFTFTQFGGEVLRLMRANEPYVVDDIETHQPPPADLLAYHATQIRAVICVPLHKAGKFVAAMAVHQATTRHWAAAEVTLVLEIASRCWEALERTRVTRVLEESEARFRALADHIPQLAWMGDAEGWLFWYNQRWLDYTGSTIEEMQGWGWEKVQHPDHLDRVATKWQRHVRAGEVWEDTFPLRGADGAYRWFLTRAVPIRDASGQVTRWFGTNTDVTEQRAAAEDLRGAKETAEAAARAVEEAAERFRLFSDVVSLQVWTASPEGHLDYANDEVARSLGVDLETGILGTRWAALVHPEDLPATSSRWTHSLETGDRYQAEFRLRVKDGTYRWYLVRAEPLRDAQGRIVRWFGNNTDIHDLKMAERAAEAASRAKDDFLAALSHELRTPLTPVLMSAAALREEERLPDDVREELTMIHRNIALEARLIDDLLDLTRIAKGKLTLRAEECDVHTLITLSVDIVRDDLRAKGIALQVQLAARRTQLTCDSSRLQQVFWNLLKNAVKFTPVQGQIAIRSHDDGDSVVVEITDTGIGIDAENLPKIFQPFEQAGRQGDHRYGGLGLGLAISRAIVELHNGVIVASSAGPGRGSTFRVELPSQERAAHSGGPAAPTDAAASAPFQAVPLRVLLVEDHEPTLTVLQRLLRRAGHTVETANSLASARKLAAAHSFDAVVSDIGLPDGTGLELMQSLHTLYGLRGVALSGYGMEEDLRRSAAAGFIAHLVKPVEFAELCRSLAAFTPAAAAPVAALGA